MTAAGDAYDAELLAALRDKFDDVDPVLASVIDAAYQVGDPTQDLQVPQTDANHQTSQEGTP